jgi:7,8-dihydropterin-6-yl-methyl-4-(beta-D-ribofuranosyl)aminobenzene 5'-phosphate synthase
MQMKYLVGSLFIALILGCSDSNDPAKSESGTKETKSYVEIPDNAIINLYDAFGKDEHALQKDFGFSAIIKSNGKTILFDAGSNADVFKANVEQLKIDLSQIDYAIASHAHFDHINGFDYLLKVNPDVKIFFPNDFFYGAPISFGIQGREPEIAESMEPHEKYFNGETDTLEFKQSGRFWGADITYVKENMEIAPGIDLISTRSRDFGYFIKEPFNPKEGEDPGLEIGLPELSLALKTSKGTALIVGCSHSGVGEIVDATKSAIDRNIQLVYGGFHLIGKDGDNIIELAQTMQGDQGVATVAPAHCTGHLGFKLFNMVYKNNYIYAGLGETIQLQ